MKRFYVLMMFFVSLIPNFVFAEGSTVDVLKTGQTTMYVSSDDGDIEAGKAWITPRFTDNGDGTVSDNETGLMWMKNATYGQSAKCTWNDAFAVIDNLNNIAYAGYTDWTLPNIKELQSFADASKPYANATVQPNPFINLAGYSFWSSTSRNYPSYPQAYIFSTRSGAIDSYTKTDVSAYVFAIRVEDLSKLTIAKTGQKTSYHSGDDGALQRGVSLTRFVDHGDGTVTDRVTGLMWLKNLSCLGRLTWTNSFGRINDLNTGNFTCSGYTADYDDWRLPNNNELLTILDFEKANQGSLAITTGHPFLWAGGVNVFWTSNTFAGDLFYQNTAWDYYVDTCYSERHRSKNGEALGVWAVRGGQID